MKMSYSTCKEGFQKFQDGNFNLQDECPRQLNKIEDEQLEKLLEEIPC